MAELGVDVGEASKLALVNIGDDQLVWRGEHGLGTGEELVKVFRPFSTLQKEKIGRASCRERV